MSSSIGLLAANQSYNPNDGLVTFASMSGENTAVTFGYIRDFVSMQITQGIVFGTRCGAAFLTLLIMWIISKSRKTPVFIMNQVTLSLMVIHSGLYFKYILSGYASIAYNLTSFPQLVRPSDLHAYAACNIVQALLVAAIEASLVFQVKVIFAGDKSKTIGLFSTALSLALALATVGMYFYSAIEPIIRLYEGTHESGSTFNVSLILLASSINLTSVLLVIKLVLAVRSRRFLGLRQFDSFHILLIISFQTLLIPSLLFILAYALPKSKGTQLLIPIATLIVALSLPLSSMWATALSNEFKPTSSSGFSPSTGGFSSGRSTYSSESVYSKAKSTIKDKIRSLYPKVAAKDNTTSEPTNMDIENMKTYGFQDLSTPVEQQNLDGFSIAKPAGGNCFADQKSWSEKNEASSCGSTPVKRVLTENSKDLPLDLFYTFDKKDEGFIETKKIILKK